MLVDFGKYVQSHLPLTLLVIKLVMLNNFHFLMLFGKCCGIQYVMTICLGVFIQ